MLKKFSRSFERKRDGKTAVKFRFDVEVQRVTGVFAAPTPLRVLWTRGSKVQVTDAAVTKAGSATFNRHLSQVATLYKDTQLHFEAKVGTEVTYMPRQGDSAQEYTFKLQSVGQDHASKKATIAKGVLDMAHFVSCGNAERPIVVPLTTNIPHLAKGLELHLHVSSFLLRGSAMDDSLSAASGLSTGTSMRSSMAEQDLTGFDGDMYRLGSETIGALTIADSTDLSKSLSQDSDKSTDSTVLAAGMHGATEIVANLQARIDELEAQAKKDAQNKDELQRLLESQRRQFEGDIAFLRRELESERSQKTELENQLVKEVDESVGQTEMEEALKSAIAPYEMRYERLVDDYQYFAQQSNTEIDGLHEELLAAKAENAKLSNQLRVSERARESLNIEKRALETSLIGSCTEHVDMDKERKELREELTHVDEVMQELIQTKLNYAQLSERHTIHKREMCKMKEKNLQLASKITRMETYLYHKESVRY